MRKQKTFPKVEELMAFERRVKRNIIITSVFLAVAIFAGVFASYQLITHHDWDLPDIILDFGDNEKIPSYQANAIAGEDYNCENLSMQDTAICLNDYVRSIFIYNITDDSLNLTLEDLKTRGGDCRDWTNFYQSNMERYGYGVNRVRIFVEEEEDYNTYHVFAVARDETGYCLMDMRILECFKYATEDGREKEPKEK